MMPNGPPPSDLLVSFFKSIQLSALNSLENNYFAEVPEVTTLKIVTF